MHTRVQSLLLGFEGDQAEKHQRLLSLFRKPSRTRTDSRTVEEYLCTHVTGNLASKTPLHGPQLFLRIIVSRTCLLVNGHS